MWPPDHRTGDVLKLTGIAGGDHDLKVDQGLVGGHRRGDANMRAVWLCTRNDVLGNVAELLAALGVFGTGTGWPDVIVAGIMASLALSGAMQILRHAADDLRAVPAPGE